MREYDLTGADGTALRAWEHGSSGPPVLISPGLGTVPEAWPSLLDRDAGVRLHSWFHRGTFGSARPQDPTRVDLDDYVADALAVLDHAGIDRCVVVGWSVGVSVAVQLALRHPERVSGLLLVAGVPGGAFGAMGGIAMPDPLRAPLARALAHGLRVAGPVLNAVGRRLPVTPATVWPLRHSGFMLPGADPVHTARAVRRFAQHDWSWYFALALALGSGPELDVGRLSCPVTALAGRYDVLTELQHLSGRLAAVPQARLRVLETSHFIPLEAPGAVRDELMLLLHRTGSLAEALDAACVPPRRGPLTRGSRAEA